MATDDLPSGGQVVSGLASIATSGTSTTITQGSDRAIVNWSGFSIGQGNSVNVVQPGSSSAILNRVTGNTTSTIAGSLTANGQVYLINPNGIAITPTGTVNVGGGFVASTLDISNEDFLKGQYNFNGNGASAGVSNEGVITVGRGGYAALIGGTVKNDGLIAVPMGKVGLGSGEQATLDLSGDGFLQVAVPTKDGAEGTGALIENGGTISAEGGTVVMKAATARNTARHAINLSGVVEANSVSGSDGAITLGGGDGGGVTVSGKVKATSTSGKGGKITVTGKSIALQGATVDASGAKGGGTVKVGGDKQGTGTTQRAETVSVDASSAIRADATESGNGGSVVVWSDTLTSFAGLITALGAGTGTGGDAEVSGKALLDYTGFTNLSGPGGFGTLLLDPYNITISSGTASNSSGTTATGNDSVINVTTLQNALAGANVTVTTGSSGSQTGNILLASPLVWSANTTLTLSAAGTIAINANMTATGASAGLVLSYGGSDYSIASGSSITLSGSNSSLTINGHAYTLVHTLQEANSLIGTSSTYVAIANDLDLSPAGTQTDSVADDFSGTLAGLGHTISNLSISNSSAGSGYYGLIGINSGTIRDIILTDANVDFASSSVTAAGIVVGKNQGTLSNVSASGSITSVGNVGGLVGYNTGTISQSSSTASVSGYNPGIGGLVGVNDVGATITKSFSGGTVSSTGNNDIGGLVGQNLGTVSYSYAYGSVASTASSGSGQSIGGLAGWNSPNGVIEYSYALGSVTADSGYYMGGLVGTSSGEISNSYSTGAVAASGSSLGLGGLVAWNNGSGSVTSSFWDEDTSGTTTGVAVTASSATTTSVTGLTTTQARTSSSYSGWDFYSVWYLSGDMRPILRSEAATVINSVQSVSNLHQLALMGSNLSGTYVLSSDIDASATAGSSTAGIWSTSGWVPIGSSGSQFTGSLSGNNHQISNITIQRSSTSGTGLFGSLGSAGTISNVGLTGVSVSGLANTGALVGSNAGTITASYASGSVTGNSDGVGGLVGLNSGSITKSYAAVTVTANGNIDAGGLVGDNLGQISQSYASGSVTGSSGGTTSSAHSLGGLVGYNAAGASITNAYATGAVSSNGGFYLGGLVGFSRGTITNTYATGAVSASGSGAFATGGLIGGTINTASITASYWDTSTSGQSAAVGYNQDTGSSNPTVSGVTGLTTSSFQDTESFYNTASAAGWNFTTVWAPPSSGYYPELYALSKVVWVSNEAYSSTYGDSSASLTSTTSYGGTSSYVFATSGDSLTLASATMSANATANVGSTTSILATTNQTVNSTNGLNYRVFYYGTLAETVTQRAITVTAASSSKTYGDTNPSLTYTITSGSLVNGDSLTGSLATSASTYSNVGTYTITQGTIANSNYNITYGSGVLTVNARPITVTATDNVKTYGDTAALSYQLTTGSLVNGDSLSGSLASNGAAATAAVGSYTITQGTLSNSNYSITYVGGVLTVNARAITVTATDVTKSYGDTATLAYQVSTGSLVNGDTLSGSLASGGSAATASPGTYTITQGSLGNSNYSISYQAGTLTVSPRAITVTANNLRKTYGDDNPALTYSITAGSLVNQDSLSGSLETLATTASSAGTYAITRGTLDNKNYAISFNPGQLTILTVAATPLAGKIPQLVSDASTQTTTVPVSIPQVVIYASNDIGNGAGVGSMTTEHPQLSGAVCSLGPNFSISCSGN